MRGLLAMVLAAGLGVAGAAVTGSTVATGSVARGSLARRSVAFSTSRSRARPRGIHKIRHVVIIMQENRSFDSYFGTYPGADGIPRGTCLPDPMRGHCARPFHDHHDRNFGGPHDAVNARADIHGGLMDGFVAQAEGGRAATRSTRTAAHAIGIGWATPATGVWM